MSETLEAVREKYPAYKDWSDSELVQAIGDKYPVYLENDPGFKSEYDIAKNPPSQTPPKALALEVEKQPVPAGGMERAARDLNAVGGPTAPPPRSPHGEVGPLSFWEGFRRSGIGQAALAPFGNLGAEEIRREGSDPTTGQVLGGAASILPFGLGPETALGKAALAYFTIHYATQLPQAVKETKQALSKGDYRTAFKIMTENVLQGGMMAAGLRMAHSPMTADAMEGASPNAIHNETKEILRDVQQPGKPEEGKGQVPADQRGTQVSAGSPQQGNQALSGKASEPSTPGPSPTTVPEKAATQGSAQAGGPSIPPAPPAISKATPTEPTAQPDKIAPEDLRPAVKIGDKLMVGEVGETHSDILTRNGYDPDQYPHRFEGRGFVDKNAPDVWLSRKTSEAASGLVGKAEAGGLDSMDLPNAAQQKVLREAGLVGMGGAAYGEVGTGEGADVYGIAERVRAQRASAGQTGEVPPGQGISAPDSVERGRQLLAGGADPEAILSNFEDTQKLSSDDMAIVRAHGEKLAQEARKIEEQYGTDSGQYTEAWTKLAEWDARSKAMQTEWHKTGMAQQGETDLDTGTFTGLQRAFRAQTGHDFTPEQAETAKKKAQKVSAATDVTDTARGALADELAKQAGSTDAEQRALDAANKAVRDNATRLAEAENKARVAATVNEREIAKVQEQEAQKALAQSQEQARKAATELAKAENERRAEQAAKSTSPKLQADKRALEAANKTVTDATARLAKAQAKAQAAKGAGSKAVADVQVKAAQRALDAANERVRKAATQAAKTEQDLQANPEKRVWQRTREYLDQGLDDFDEIRSKVATDLGMKVDEVTKWLTYNKRAKYLADDLWRKQQQERLLKQQAKRWLTDAQTPGYKKALSFIPRAMFSLKVGIHGTVALGTHAPMVAFQPRFWKAYVRDFGKMYRMVASPSYYEHQVQDLVRRPNYTTARRAGLVNDPASYEDFNSPDMSAYIGRLSGMGDRGYSVLKILRQDMFDQYWNKLPKTTQIPEVAQAIADGVNHATGVVKGMAPKGSNVVLFAPRLEASRVAWLAADPIKMVDTFTRWNSATPGEKQFALNQIKEKAWVAGTLFSMLALNQGVLSATDSKQKINFTDPMKGDFLKFKAAGMTISYGNAMMTMARLPVRLYSIRESTGGKLKSLVYPDENTYTVLGEYARSQLSPYASLVTDLWLRSDWLGRQLPSSNRPMPKRLLRQGIQPYTWPEFWSEQSLPIPAEEAVREVWRTGFGMDEEQVKQMRKAMATLAVMTATGARVTDDWDVQQPTPSP